MSDLISRSALIRFIDVGHLRHPTELCYSELDVANLIKNAPAVDAVPVVHGRWIDHLVRDWRCSECGEKVNKIRNVDGYCYDDKPNYCPNCGADMRERRDNG